MGRHRASGERDLAGRSWHRRGDRRGRSGRMRPPSSRARGSECRSEMTRGRRDGDTPRATRGRERRRTRRPSARRHGGHCGGDERDRGDGPPTPDPAGQEHVPLSRSARSGAWQPRTGNASKVHGYSKVRISASATRRNGGQDLYARPSSGPRPRHALIPGQWTGRDAIQVADIVAGMARAGS